MAGGDDGRVAGVFLAVGQAVAVECADGASGFLEDALCGTGVPFHRGDESRIKVRRALGHEAELERAAHADQFGAGQFLKHGGDLRAGMVSAGHDTKFVLIDFADLNLLWLCLAKPLERAVATTGEVLEA